MVTQDIDLSKTKTYKNIKIIYPGQMEDCL